MMNFIIFKHRVNYFIFIFLIIFITIIKAEIETATVTSIAAAARVTATAIESETETEIVTAIAGSHLNANLNLNLNLNLNVPPADHVTNEYDWRQAINSVSLSAISYCKNNTILKGNFSANQLSNLYEKDKFPLNINDFIVTDLIHNTDHDVNGFVGYSIQEKTIFVVFRGSVSPANWLDNFDTVMTRYPPCSG